MADLIRGFAAERVIAFRKGVPITQSEFLADVLAGADALPDAPCAINLCEDRYNFMVAFAAAFVPRQIILVPELPRNATGKLPMDTLRAMAARAD